MDRLDVATNRVTLAWFTVGAVNVTRLSKTDKSSLPRCLSPLLRLSTMWFSTDPRGRRRLLLEPPPPVLGLDPEVLANWFEYWTLGRLDLPAKKRSSPLVDVFRLGVYDGGSIANKLSLYIGEMEPDGRGLKPGRWRCFQFWDRLSLWPGVVWWCTRMREVICGHAFLRSWEFLLDYFYSFFLFLDSVLFLC